MLAAQLRCLHACFRLLQDAYDLFSRVAALLHPVLLAGASLLPIIGELSCLLDLSEGCSSPVLAAQRTLDRDPRRRQRLNASGDVLAASFAADHEVAPALRTLEYGHRIGE
jgi:hypothetical protein